MKYLYVCCYRWLVQFGVGSRDDIVCSKDGTRRKGEPSAEENLTCVAVFVLVRREMKFISFCTICSDGGGIFDCPASF